MNEKAGGDVIRRTRFLLVDGDKKALETVEQFLKSAGAPQVYVATAPILGLRVLQDASTRVDCVICAHKSGTITGLQFLQTLRSGRWGVGAIRNVKFIMLMGRLDVAAAQAADASGVSGYYVGALAREPFLADIAAALTSERGVSPLPKMQVAHVNMGGADFIFVPIDAGFAQADPGNQQAVMGEIQSLMQEQQLAGAVTPVWEQPDRSVGYFAAPQHHSRLKQLTFDFVRANLNRELTVLQPPRYAKLSSPGSAAYAALLAEGGKTDLGNGELNLAGYEAREEAPGGSGGVSGGAPSGGVNGGPKQ